MPYISSSTSVPIFPDIKKRDKTNIVDHHFIEVLVEHSLEKRLPSRRLRATEIVDVVSEIDNINKTRNMDRLLHPSVKFSGIDEFLLTVEMGEEGVVEDAEFRFYYFCRNGFFTPFIWISIRRSQL